MVFESWVERYTVQGSRFKVQRFKVQGFRVQGSRFRGIVTVNSDRIDCLVR
jgi:hypothetical protein